MRVGAGYDKNGDGLETVSIPITVDTTIYRGLLQYLGKVGVLFGILSEGGV